jgi:hypothetical protein
MEVYNHEHSHQKTKEISNKQSDDISQTLKSKQEQDSPKNNGWKQLIKNQSRNQ